MAMRDEIFNAIEEGGATKQSLLDLTGTTEKGLASQMTYLRMMGKCPMVKEDGTYKIVSTEEWESYKASRVSKTAGKTLTPAEKVERAQKREQRASTALDNAKKRADSDPDNRLFKLQVVKAEAELEISSIELGKAEEELASAPQEETDAADDVSEGPHPTYDEDEVEEEYEGEDLE